MTDSDNEKSGKKRINEPVTDVDYPTHTLDELTDAMQERIAGIQQEFIDGFYFVRQYQRSVTVFGSARFSEDHEYYAKARRVTKRLADNGITVITGGGPGIMEAGNRGACESDGDGASLGLNIELPAEQVLNSYVEKSQSFAHFFTRKVALTFAAEAYVFFPGGFGTLDEFIEILTLVQTGKIERVPIVLVGEDYWNGLDDFFQNTLSKQYETIDAADTGLYTITDDEDEVVEIALNAPLRDE